MAARTRRTVLTEEWKKRIASGKIMKRIEECALGDIEMTSNQLKAADILLKKIIPDLARQELVGDKDAPIELRVTTETDQVIIDRYINKMLEGKKDE